MTDAEVVNEVYAAINRNDIPATLNFFDPEIERIEPAGFPTAGIYRGHKEMKEHLLQGRGTWAEGFCQPEQIFAAGNKIVAFLHVRVTLKKNMELVEGRFADGFIFRNGKILQMRSFAERQEALDWAGVKADS